MNKKFKLLRDINVCGVIYKQGSVVDLEPSLLENDTFLLMVGHGSFFELKNKVDVIPTKK